MRKYIFLFVGIFVLMLSSCKKEDKLKSIDIAGDKSGFVGDVINLEIIHEPSSIILEEVSWTSNDDSLATVNEEGKVDLIKVGNVIITATYKEFTANHNIEIKEIVVESINVIGESAGYIDDEIILSVYFLPKDPSVKEVVWTSSDENIATVNSGVVTLLKEGTVTITTTYKTLYFNHVISVSKKEVFAEEVIITGEDNILAGEEVNLSTSVLPTDADNKEIVWSSSDEEVADIVGGLVTSYKAGNVTIKASIRGNEAVYGEFNLTINENFDAFYEGDNKIDINETRELTINTFNSSLDLIITSSDESVLEVLEHTLIPKEEGIATITISLGEAVTKQYGFVVLDKEFANLVSYLKKIGYTSVSGETIKYVGSDDGSNDYINFVYPLIYPYLDEHNEITKRILPEGKENHSGKKLTSLEWIVIHDTANANTGAGAAGHANWVLNPDNKSTSWHFTVGNDGIYQHLELDTAGRHTMEAGFVDAAFIDTGIPATILKPNMTISSDGYYVILDTKTNVKAPLVRGRLPKDSDIVDLGIWPVIIEGTYHIPETRFLDVFGGNIVINGGSLNGIGIEMAVNNDSNVFLTWQRTAKLVAELLIEHDLMLDRVVFHNLFSGKPCPRTALESNNIETLLKYIEIEYTILKYYSNYNIEFISGNKNFLADNGLILIDPNFDSVVMYSIKVTNDKGKTETIDFRTSIRVQK